MRIFYFFTSLIILFFLAFQLDVYTQDNRVSLIKTVSIQDVVNEINQDSVTNIIQNLQNFETRFMRNENRRPIYKWIRNKFISYGFTDVAIDSFSCTTNYLGTTTSTQYNVVAKLPGTRTPGQNYLIGGHYDSYSTGSITRAPGADDNASGTAAVLESARVIMKKNYMPASTLVFIAFAAEELMRYGDSGSSHYANNAQTTGMDIKLMINNDMIAYSPNTPEQSIVNINYYSNSVEQKNFAKNITYSYSKVPPTDGARNQVADGYSFYIAGFPVVYFEEHVFSPFYHSSEDMISNYNMPYCTEIIKASCATLLSYAEITTPVEKEENIPNNYLLSQNYPNPFNPVTTIKYSIPKSQFVTLKVFDILGREVKTLVNEGKSAGTYQVQFNGGNLSSGTYIYRLNAGMYNESKKFILLK